MIARPGNLSATFALLAAGMALSSGTALAQKAIGGTVVVQNDVRSQHVGKRQFLRLRKGAHVFQDDLVRTRKNSLTKIVFLDKTNMSVGPESEAKLDRFVYNGDGTAKDVVINATKGAFRFFSGKSESKAYRVITPRAVIGVRGTTYDVRITNQETLVVLQAGEVNVCVRNTANCRIMNQPGQSLTVNDNGITDPAPPANKPWDFASNCTGGASVLCAQTTQFALAPAPKRAVAPARVKPKPKPRARPKRRARRDNRRIRPQRRIVRRPRGEYIREPIYDPPPRRGIVIEEPVYVPPPRCYPGSRHPRCRTVRPRPRPCYGVWRRGRCIPRPIVRPRPCYGVWRHGRCVSKPIVRPRPKPCRYSRGGCRTRPIYGPRPPVHGRPVYRPRPRPIYRPRPPVHGRPVYRPRRPSYRGPGRIDRRIIRQRGARDRYNSRRIR